MPILWHFLSELIENKNPSSPQEDGAEVKIREYNLSYPMNIPPLHLYFPHKWLSKKPRAETTRLSAGFPSKSVFLLK